MFHHRTFRHSGSKLLQCFVVHHRTFQHSGSELLHCFVVHHRTFQNSGGELLHRLFRGWLHDKVCFAAHCLVSFLGAGLNAGGTE